MKWGRGEAEQGMGQGSGLCRNKFHPQQLSVRHLPLWLTTSVPQHSYGCDLDPFQYPKAVDLGPRSPRARVTHRVLQHVPARNFRRPGVHLHRRSSLGSWVLGEPSRCRALGRALATLERAQGQVQTGPAAGQSGFAACFHPSEKVTWEELCRYLVILVTVTR